MAKSQCTYCRKSFQNLYAHQVKCEMKLVIDRMSKQSKRAAMEVVSSRNAIRQKVNTERTAASLLGDTHGAQPSIVSNQLHNVTSMRERANVARASGSKHNQQQDGVVLNPNDSNNLPHNPDYNDIGDDDISFGLVDYDDDVSFSEDEESSQNANENKSKKTKTEEEDLEFLARFVKYIDPDAKDPFDPDSINEDAMEFVEPMKDRGTYNPHNHILAQIDLLRLLMRSGCSLNMFDKIIRWVQHYSRLQTAGNIWTDYPYESRTTFIKKLSEEMKTDRHKPVMREIQFEYDKRKISVPTFSFVSEAMSLLEDPTVMTEANIIDGYDIHSGKCGEDFWIPETISKDIANATPTPVDPNRKIGDITTSYLHQQAVSRFCTQPHHMPVPLILFYDKANLDQKGGLAVAPLLFTFGFFKAAARHKSFIWRVLAYVPNLDIGQGKSNTKDADEKQREHHKVLTEALRELQEICEAGGIKTVINGKVVVLKFYIAFIIGDTSGHNELCLRFNSSNTERPCRDCHCLRSEISLFDPDICKPFTLKDIVETGGSEEKLKALSQRYRIENAFYKLPFADRLMGCHGSTPWETLHVFDQGLGKYVPESLHDIIGVKSAGKLEKEALVKLFRVIHSALERQSERDFPRRSVRFSPLDGTKITAKESVGNSVPFIICFFTRDGRLLLGRVFDKWNSDHPGPIGPSIKGCAEAWIDLICYEKWIKEENPAGEVIASGTRISQVLTKVSQRFPRRDGTDQWNLPKAHGALKMGDTQIPKHGNGAGCDSSHGERMHQTFFTRLGYNTQRRIDSFATQLANRRWEDVALQTATNHLKHRLMDLGKVEEDVSYNEENNNATGWDYHNEDIPRLGDFTGSGHYVATWHGHRCNELDFEIKWTNTDAQLIGKKLHDQLLYALVLHAKAQKWKQTFKVSGYTSIKKEDVTTTTINLYRSDTDRLRISAALRI